MRRLVFHPVHLTGLSFWNNKLDATVLSDVGMHLAGVFVVSLLTLEKQNHSVD